MRSLAVTSFPAGGTTTFSVSSSSFGQFSSVATYLASETCRAFIDGGTSSTFLPASQGQWTMRHITPL